MTAQRWGGRLTSRDLPDQDETIDKLEPAVREELAQHWLERAAAERRVGDSFGVIRDTLEELGADPQLVELAERAVDDESRHEELSRLVASRFAGRALPAPARLPMTVPQHEGATDTERRVFWVVGQCCLNETMASAVLEASLAVTTGPYAKAALRELLSDEVDHARLGWAFLATVDRGAKDAVARRALGLTRANVKMWRETPRSYPSRPELVVQGALTRDLIEGALRLAVRDLVIPGFQQLGLDTAAVSAWVDAGAPT